VASSADAGKRRDVVFREKGGLDARRLFDSSADHRSDGHIAHLRRSLVHIQHPRSSIGVNDAAHRQHEIEALLFDVPAQMLALTDVEQNAAVGGETVALFEGRHKAIGRSESRTIAQSAPVFRYTNIRCQLECSLFDLLMAHCGSCSQHAVAQQSFLQWSEGAIVTAAVVDSRLSHSGLVSRSLRS